MQISLTESLAAGLLLIAVGGGASACSFQRNAAADAKMQLAQTSDARPSRGPQSQTSVPAAAPAANPSQTTGSANQPPVVKEMNREEEKKVEKEGK
jgi:hypothetical protein